MNLILSFNLIVILISYFARFKKSKYTLEISFLIIFIFTAFRYNFGTDYSTYHDLFLIYKSYSLSEILDNSLDIEIGWILINYLFAPFGFFALIFTLSAFFCYTYYSIIKKYLTVNYYWFAVFIYVFTFEIMMIQFSAIRQALAIAIFLNAIKYISEVNRPLIYLMMILIAGLIHTSAFFMLPFVLLTSIKNKNSNSIGYLISTLFLFLLLFGNIVLQYFPTILALTNGAKYLSNLENDISGSSSFVGVLFWSLLCVLTLYYSLEQPKVIKVLFHFVLFYFVIYTLINLVWLVNRLGFYFVPLTIIVYPLILQSEKKMLLKLILFALFVLSILYQLAKYLPLDWVILGYTDYKTIFSVW